jgi:hypothetical protein
VSTPYWNWSGQWTIPDFTPFMIPGGVRLTSYGGQAADLPADIFAHQLQVIAAGSLKVPVAKVYHGLDSQPERPSSPQPSTTTRRHATSPRCFR